MQHQLQLKVAEAPPKMSHLSLPKSTTLQLQRWITGAMLKHTITEAVRAQTDARF